MTLAIRILKAAPVLDDRTAHDLLRRLRNRLKAAYDEDVLDVAAHDIFRYVDFVAPPSAPIGSGVRAIAGGEKDFKRNPESAQLRRRDGAWFHFTLTVVEDDNAPLALLAYDFELVYPATHVPPFVRFDLNLPGHSNDEHGLRSHMHPGNDDLQLPAPVLEPLEALSLMLSLKIVAK